VGRVCHSVWNRPVTRHLKRCVWHFHPLYPPYCCLKALPPLPSSLAVGVTCCRYRHSSSAVGIFFAASTVVDVRRQCQFTIHRRSLVSVRSHALHLDHHRRRLSPSLPSPSVTLRRPSRQFPILSITHTHVRSGRSRRESSSRTR
jgi:hypothetical protein